MTIELETKTKKVSDMTEDELREMIMNLASKPILIMSGILSDLKKTISSNGNGGHCS